MCTVVVLRRPNSPWPLLAAANRDEMAGRPWRSPGRHWPDRAEVVAGRDDLAGGSWLGLNDTGVMAAMLNRMGTLGPEAGKRSRGELVLEALDHADADAAVRALTDLRAAAYRPFNMLVADNRDAFWLRADGARLNVTPLAEGFSMLTAFELNDESDPRIRAFLPRFRAAPPPDPDQDDWQAWQTLLATRAPSGSLNREDGLSFQLDNGFGTRSAALLALPAMHRAGVRPRFLFAAGAPGETPFLPVTA
ncbi:hypothetical protein GALL_229400 [mine drainage metagenome]|uniref:NRDE family protein n=1 Tax=mine drainage metagenome TaxID=410659 RepID=A0A1J5RST2_9ZZZZ